MHSSRLLRLGRAVKLPALPIAMPTEGPFAVDAAGMAKPPTYAQLVDTRGAILRDAEPITKDTFWRMPIHDSLKHIAKTCSYLHVAEIAMEQSFFSLFEDMLNSHDAPLPHVIYTDLLKCKTFASLQLPPDEQFSLEPGILRSLLHMASFHLLHDPHYFASVEKLFRTIELQQTVGSEVLSAWVQCCVFAGKTALAVQTLQRMEANKVPFDMDVFCAMMAPTSVGPRPSVTGDPSVRLAHQRLFAKMSAVSTPSAIGVHAAFVANSLLMRHAAKWEVLRLALTHPSVKGATAGGSGGVVSVAERTLDLSAAVLDLERGARCGPKTSEALAVAYAQQAQGASAAGSKATESLFKTLYYMRCAEALPQYADEPMATFSEEAQEVIEVALRRTMATQPERKLQASSCLYLLNHTADEFRNGVRPEGPLAAKMKGSSNPSDRLQFGELLALMNYKGSTGGAAARPFQQVGAGAGDSLVVADEAAAEEKAPSDVPPPQAAIPKHRYEGVSRVAEEEAKANAKEAWARARLQSAWMDPSTVVP